MSYIRTDVSVHVTESPFKESQCECIIDPKNPDKIIEVVYRSDISTLLYDRKRRAVSDIVYNDLVAHLNNSHQNLLSQLDETVSDDQILDTVKSRYIQSIGDIQAYSDFLSESVDKVTGSIKDAQEKEEHFKKLMEKLNAKSD